MFLVLSGLLSCSSLYYRPGLLGNNDITTLTICVSHSVGPPPTSCNHIALISVGSWILTLESWKQKSDDPVLGQMMAGARGISWCSGNSGAASSATGP